MQSMRIHAQADVVAHKRRLPRQVSLVVVFLFLEED
jgi:hypothetical protein